MRDNPKTPFTPESVPARSHEKEPQSFEERRFRTNPIELIILFIMTLVVGNSVYNLLYGTDSFRPTALKPMAANPISEGRGISSSAGSPFANLEVKCGSEMGSAENGPPSRNSQVNFRETNANKVRLMGALCGQEGLAGGQLLRATVLNSSNRFNATVFTDSNSPQFTTDYIPLSAGKNVLRLEFSYRNGKTINQEMIVTKLDPNSGSVDSGAPPEKQIDAKATERSEGSE